MKFGELKRGGETFIGPTNDNSVEHDYSDSNDDDDDSDYCPFEVAGEDRTTKTKNTVIQK
jgi:hypothetical protein